MLVYTSLGNTQEWSITLCLMMETLLMLKQITQCYCNINVSSWAVVMEVDPSPVTLVWASACVVVWGYGGRECREKRSHCPQCSLQVDTMVVEMCLWGNRMSLKMPVPICSSCVTSSILRSELWWANCQQCQLFFAPTKYKAWIDHPQSWQWHGKPPLLDTTNWDHCS